MDETLFDPGALSRPELISLYIEGYYQLDAEGRSRFEAEFRKRKLPLPRMPEALPAPAAPRPTGIDAKCFLSYLLLISSGTAVFYSWFYLAMRLVKLDFRENARHKLIQSGIALLYIVAEILLFGLFVKGKNPPPQRTNVMLPATVGQMEARLAGEKAAMPLRGRVQESIRGDSARAAGVISSWLSESTPRLPAGR